MTLASKQQFGFTSVSLHQKREPHAFYYLSQRVTFWIAVLSLFAFVTGNMVGQNGWHVFWKSVLGEYDDSLVVYDGTVMPIAKVPRYSQWSLYGGDASVHTFRQVPESALMSMPPYEPFDTRRTTNPDVTLLYAIDNFGTYATGGGKGGHVGIDIRLPDGTPILAIMNGFVVQSREDAGGFGKYILLKHPRVPDPDNPNNVTTLYSLYAHLSNTLVSEGMPVRKGEQIALSGMTGNASGPHLHLQMQRETCKDTGEVIGPHTFWAFTSADARDAGLSFSQAINEGLKRDHGMQCTVNPLLYVQAQYAPVAGTVVAKAQQASSRTKTSAAELRKARLQARVDQRKRLAMSKPQPVLAVVTPPATSLPSTSASSSSAKPIILAYADPAESASFPFAGIQIQHDRFFVSREWEKVYFTLLDSNGNRMENVNFNGDLYLRTAFGEAEFKPAVLTSLDFQGGRAEVEMLPRGQKTVIINVQPLGVLSTPMQFER